MSHTSRPIFLLLTAARLFLGVACVLLPLAGCSLAGRQTEEESKLIIPDFDNAKEQYGFATLYKSAMVPSPEKNRRTQQLERLVQCYQRVVENFPDDRKFTPLARLEIADTAGALNDFEGARRQYDEIIQAYPSEQYIQARALFSIGLTLDAEGKYQEAKDVYRQVNEDFGKSPMPGIREIVKKADTLYYKVRETKPKAAKPKRPREAPKHHTDSIL